MQRDLGCRAAHNDHYMVPIYEVHNIFVFSVLSSIFLVVDARSTNHVRVNHLRPMSQPIFFHQNLGWNAIFVNSSILNGTCCVYHLHHMRITFTFSSTFQFFNFFGHEIRLSQFTQDQRSWNVQFIPCFAYVHTTLRDVAYTKCTPQHTSRIYIIHFVCRLTYATHSQILERRWVIARRK